MIYMGAAVGFSRALIEAGMAAETPVLVAVNASLPSERLIHGHLSTPPFLVKAASDDNPTLLLIGEVVDPDRTRCSAWEIPIGESPQPAR